MCVNAWCGVFIWWMWWGMMNGCHEKTRREKIWHTQKKNTQTHLSLFEVFVLLQCWRCTINTLIRDTEKLQHINAFTGGAQRNTSQLAQNRLVSVIISCCCLSWSLTVTPSQCTLQMHIHCYKSHVHEWLYLHYGCSFCTIDMNNRSSKKHDSGYTRKYLSVHELDSLKLHILTKYHIWMILWIHSCINDIKCEKVRRAWTQSKFLEVQKGFWLCFIYF